MCNEDDETINPLDWVSDYPKHLMYSETPDTHEDVIVVSTSQAKEIERDGLVPNWAKGCFEPATRKRKIILMV